MYSIGDYVGQKVRRISFIVKRADDGQYHHLLSLVEYLFPDMQDYNEFKTQKKNVLIDFVKEGDGNKDKVFFVVDFPVLTEEYLKTPNTFIVDNDKVLPWATNNAGGCWKYDRPVIVSLHKDKKGALAYLLPNR